MVSFLNGKSGKTFEDLQKEIGVASVITLMNPYEPSAEEMRRLDELAAWRDRSARSNFVLGGPG